VDIIRIILVYYTVRELFVVFSYYNAEREQNEAVMDFFKSQRI